ncbi:hypothetical protein JCM9140_2803 [Halalkalibacter wakoensis JCM 9140]|uniref:Uncharacterized protein n=1 Tax=Halalkalibacter wakoensis JCM 9140 TaxID=1236970 RepID=W4Q4S0_9BACI|nr:hypothetical protein [Halalkalibacter wakoensis]GAE26713.1 hypothetical protein JCM9140_2803 [Halalkalibacter wakoensis JCM 9140]
MSEFNKLQKKLNDSVRSAVENSANVQKSGNSDVDVTVNVNIDTTAIAYALAFALHTSGKIDDEEYKKVIKKINKKDKIEVLKAILDGDRGLFGK